MKQNGKILAGKNLKVTPQRLAILDAVNHLNHPSADEITEYIRKNHPNIATGTIYKTLETFVQRGIIKKVKTESDIMKYDGVLSPHHHLYCTGSGRIEDYDDAGLNTLLNDYFSHKNIPGFEIQDIKLQIIGRFTNA
ncbi:MAG TPA: transcriptional repressor [Bacteroidales bacterium]|nr:transcriptional repressor [Bacteroidales bacterium]HPT02341.1 transcriptional repressor [Bacteroidales bacterium]